jgi:hypothetical protein
MISFKSRNQGQKCKSEDDNETNESLHLPELIDVHQEEKSEGVTPRPSHPTQLHLPLCIAQKPPTM